MHFARIYVPWALNRIGDRNVVVESLIAQMAFYFSSGIEIVRKLPPKDIVGVSEDDFSAKPDPEVWLEVSSNFDEEKAQGAARLVREKLLYFEAVPRDLVVAVVRRST